MSTTWYSIPLQHQPLQITLQVVYKGVPTFVVFKNCQESYFSICFLGEFCEEDMKVLLRFVNFSIN